MIKKIGLVKSARINQGQTNWKKFTFFCGTALLAAMFMAGCQKDNSSSPTPVLPAVTTDLTATNDPDAAPLNLRSAINFTILSETGISTTGATSITGNIGVSPIAGTGITGFGLTMDASNQFSRTPIVTGEVFAASYAAPTPTMMTTAISDMKTAFTAANGRTRPNPIVEKYAGNISGRTLPPGLYKWSTGVLVTDAGVKLSGLADDVWVFQISKNLQIDNNAVILLVGGAQAKNVFWVVSGKAVLGTAVNFKGNILSKTLISVKAGSHITGRLLAQTAVTLISDGVHPQ